MLVRSLISQARPLLGRTEQHFFYTPQQNLAPFISHYTLTLGSFGFSKPVADEPGVLHIVPDASGCIVGSFDGKRLKLGYWGPSSRVVSLKKDLDSGPFRFYVEFLPGAARHFLRFPLHEVRDGIYALEEVDPALSQSLERIFAAASLEVPKLMAGLDAVFSARLVGGGQSPLLGYVLQRLRENGGCGRMEDLAAESGYSARHLNRLLQEDVGLNLKLLSRIFRINRACLLLPLRDDLTALAQELGYHDQAHFIHDFQGVCGVSPGKYKRGMSDFYNEEIKAGTMVP